MPSDELAKALPRPPEGMRWRIGNQQFNSTKGNTTYIEHDHALYLDSLINAAWVCVSMERLAQLNTEYIVSIAEIVLRVREESLERQRTAWALKKEFYGVY